MQGKGLISVIVPVYNVEQYLDACIQSILNQSYSFFEMILVDDGSTDRSGALCDEWQMKDSRIRVFHQENGGLSAARNTGIRYAGGEYICFVDSDDWIASDYLKILYENLLAFHADVSCCRYISFVEGDEEEKRRLKSYETHKEKNCPQLRTRENLWDTLTDVGADCQSTWLVVAWNKLIRRAILEDISFPVGRWHEDEFFIHRLLVRTSRFVDTSAQLYFYRKRADGICGDKNRLDPRHLDMVDAWEERVKVYRRESRREMILYHKMISAYRMTIRIQYSDFNYGIPAIRLKLRYLRSYFQYPEVRWRLNKMLGKN